MTDTPMTLLGFDYGEKHIGVAVGQTLTAPRAFDPTADAVSTATISSAIIFDTILNEGELLAELKEEGVF